MKHNIKINIIMVTLFLLAQFAGLYIVNSYIDHKATDAAHVVEWKKLPYNLERPEVKSQSTSFIPILIAILIGTLLFLALIKYRKPILIKIWFFLTFWITLAISFNVFMATYLAAIIAFVLALIRMFRNNVWTHNLTEVFIYGGIAAIFVPMLNVLSAFVLLILISIYDVIAVWKTKHMIKLAEFQAKSKIFAGLFIPYGRKTDTKNTSSKTSLSESKKISKPSAKTNIPTAILGGGDIGFPLIFAGVVMKGFMLKETVIVGFLKTSAIPLLAAAALLVLLLKGDKNKYYPAMPFISIGCFIGYFLLLFL